MGHTGTYIWEDGKIVKVSDEVPNLCKNYCNGPVWFPKGGYKYYDKALNKTFYSKQEKVDYMKAKGIVNEGSSYNDKKMINKNCELINHERGKQGLPSKTKSELIGDSRDI